MSAELRGYAEAIVGCVTKSETEHGRQYDRDTSKFGFGLMEPYELATAYLASHPADSDEPASQLTGIVHQDSHQSIRVGISGIGRYGLFLTRWNMPHPSSNCTDMWLCDVKTKGDVRRLLAALKGE